MSKWDDLQLHEFLSLNPKMRLVEFGEGGVVVEGDFDINAKATGFNLIQDTYKLKIVFSKDYPRTIPFVSEMDYRIPRNSEHHVYSNGSFCLGSELKLKVILSNAPSVPKFVSEILEPFLYSVSYKLKYDEYPIGELDHGEDGLLDDYEQLFGVKGKAAVLKTLSALGKRKRVANKLQCPCGCKIRIGKCDFRFKLVDWRFLDKRSWFREHLKSFTPIPPVSKKTRKHKRNVNSTSR